MEKEEIKSKEDFRDFMDKADFTPLPKEWSFGDWKLKIKEIMESPETKDYIAKLNKQDLIREQELKRFMARFNTKEKFTALVDGIIRHYNSDKYCSRYDKIGVIPPKKLESVIVSYLNKKGKQPSRELIRKHAGYFTSQYGILFGMLIVVNTGQGEMHLEYIKL